MRKQYANSDSHALLIVFLIKITYGPRHRKKTKNSVIGTKRRRIWKENLLLQLQAHYIGGNDKT